MSFYLDEQIIPATTKRSSGVKQYNPKKTHKWGFKNMVRAGQSGMTYDFFMYDGKHSAGAERCGVKNLFYVLSKNSPNIKTFAYILIIGSQCFYF